MKNVLITGSTGLIGTLLHRRLAGRYRFFGLARGSDDAIPTTVADITDFDAMRPAFVGMDAVVHMAAVAHVGAPWEQVRRVNVDGTRNVYEAARQAGVDLVVFASSNHAVAGWEVEYGPSVYDLDDPRQLDEHVQIRPDSYYGWSKAAGESLGRHYVDMHGLRVHCLRIGWVLRGDDVATADISSEIAPPLSAEHVRARARAIYLSHADCAQLVGCCLDADHIRFGIYYGISNNPRQFYDLANARREIGYAPADSAPVEL